MAGQNNERIRTRMEGYDYEILDKTAKEIIETAEQTGAEVRELAPDISSDQNLSGESIEPSSMAGLAGALLG